MIKDGRFYEIKMNHDKDGNEREDYDEWYLHNSVLQCAFYKSLLLRMKGDILFTPKFRLREGFERAMLKVDKSSDYILRFGEIGDFRVDVRDPDTIIDFFKEKIEHLDDYDTAGEFDLRFKRKEFDTLKDCFAFEKIERKTYVNENDN